jgi:hypothetical protein
MKLQNVDTNRKLMAKLVSSGGAFNSTGEDLVKEFSTTEAAVRSLLARFQKAGLMRAIGGNGFSEKRLFVLTDDISLLAGNDHLLRGQPPKPLEVKSLECRAKQYVRARFTPGLNRDVAVCVLKDFAEWDKGA